MPAELQICSRCGGCAARPRAEIMCPPRMGGAMTSSPPLSSSDNDAPYYIIFDVDIWDPDRYLTYMQQVRPALEAAGGRYLVRGSAHKIYEGDWVPKRLV